MLLELQGIAAPTTLLCNLFQNAKRCAAPIALTGAALGFPIHLSMAVIRALSKTLAYAARIYIYLSLGCALTLY